MIDAVLLLTQGGLDFTSTWCLLETFRAFELLKNKKESQFFNLRKLIYIDRLFITKKINKKDLFTNLR